MMVSNPFDHFFGVFDLLNGYLGSQEMNILMSKGHDIANRFHLTVIFSIANTSKLDIDIDIFIQLQIRVA